MARGTTLNDIVEMVRDECGLSSNSSRGQDQRPYLERLIRRHYEMLYDDYDWPHLALHREDSRKTLASGQRYYDFPTHINVERVKGASVKWGNVWTPLTYGITLDHYSAYDSDNDLRADPATHWVIRDDKQFEIWPMPASNIMEVAFDGYRKLTPLNENNDRADLDDLLISLFVAAEVLKKTKQADADEKKAAGIARLRRLRGRLGGHKRVRMGLGGVDLNKRGSEDRIQVAYVRNP